MPDELYDKLSRFLILKDYMPEELYDKLSPQLGAERSQLQNDYPNSQELELDPQPEFIWRRI